MSFERLHSKFEQLYKIELTYVPECWKLCGDGHCCHLTRYRNNPKQMQPLPLMPGELQFMQKTGYINQYSNPKVRSQRFEFEFGPLYFDQLEVDLKNGGCPCTHDIRPTICRMYPFLPTFDPKAGVTGFDPNFTVYEEAEEHLHAPRVCQVTEIPTDKKPQLDQFLKILTSEPLFMFYLSVYRRIKMAFASEIDALSGVKDVKTGVEAASKNLIFKLKTGKAPEVIRDINSLADRYKSAFGDQLQFG